MASSKQRTLRAIASVTAIAVSAAVLVTGSYEISYERIEENHQARLLRTLHQVLDPASHDNQLTQNRRAVRDLTLLGSSDPMDVFIATREGRPTAALLSSVAPRGYSGPIHLLIGISADGTVTGVRVTSTAALTAIAVTDAIARNVRCLELAIDSWSRISIQ